MSMVQGDDGEGCAESGGGGPSQCLLESILPAAPCEEEEGPSGEEWLDMMQQIEEAVMAEILEQGLSARPPLCARVPVSLRAFLCVRVFLLLERRRSSACSSIWLASCPPAARCPYAARARVLVCRPVFAPLIPSRFVHTLTCALLSEQAQLQDYLDHERAEDEALLESAARADQDEVLLLLPFVPLSPLRPAALMWLLPPSRVPHPLAWNMT